MTLTPDLLSDQRPSVARSFSVNRPTLAHRRVICTWSGGIDSTAVLAHLLARGYEVTIVTLSIYGADFGQREQHARDALLPYLQQLAARFGGTITAWDTVVQTGWLWAFSPDGVEIPRRNKHILDYIVTRYGMRSGVRNIAMGEYTGADTWLVRDHVAASDADHRALASYLLTEYGLSWRLLSLQDFGESRFKSDRVRLLDDALPDLAHLTSNCLVDAPVHCGACYKCVERAAAFDVAGLRDRTVYARNPRTSEHFERYLRQMRGFDVEAPSSVFTTSHRMPTPAAAPK